MESFPFIGTEPFEPFELENDILTALLSKQKQFRRLAGLPVYLNLPIKMVYYHRVVIGDY